MPPGAALGFEIQFEELPVGRSVPVGPVQVSAFETRHQPDAHPHGMLIQMGSQQIAYSGDTGWLDALPQIVAGSDLFICECTYLRSDFDYHINHQQLVEHKHEIDAGRVVLTHLGAEMREKVSDAAFETADDGLRIKV